MNTLLLTLALLHVADIGMTVDLLNRYDGHEINPFLPQNQVGIVAITTAESTLQIYALHELNKNHSKLAKAMTFISIGLEGLVVYHNAKQYR